jgi:phenylacetate-coenzyme A ligase PaaK-like adenylate-forming protein
MSRVSVSDFMSAEAEARSLVGPPPKRRWERPALSTMLRVGSQRLERLLVAALTETTHYRPLAASLGEARAFSLLDFPVLTKQTLQSSMSALIRADDASSEMPRGQLFLTRTSGSTGQSCSTIRGRLGALADRAVRERLLSDANCPRQGDTFELGLRPISAYLEPARRGPNGVQWNLPVLGDDLDSRASDVYAAATLLSRPVLMHGDSKLVRLAEYCRDNAVYLNPSVVLWSYELLLSPARTFLEQTFQTRVRSIYGTAETGTIGYECELFSMHFDPDVVVVECLDEHDKPVDDPESYGRLIATSLTSDPMPIIRYDTGDLCRPLSECPCGLATPAIGGLVGRAAIRLVARDGQHFPPYRLMAHVAELGLKDYQLVQENLERIEIRHQGPALTNEVLRALHARLLTGGRDFALVDGAGLPFLRTDNGKRNVVVQHMVVNHLAGDRSG